MRRAVVAVCVCCRHKDAKLFAEIWRQLDIADAQRVRAITEALSSSSPRIGRPPPLRSLREPTPAGCRCFPSFWPIAGRRWVSRIAARLEAEGIAIWHRSYSVPRAAPGRGGVTAAEDLSAVGRRRRPVECSPGSGGVRRPAGPGGATYPPKWKIGRTCDGPGRVTVRLRPFAARSSRAGARDLRPCAWAAW